MNLFADRCALHRISLKAIVFAIVERFVFSHIGTIFGRNFPKP